MKFPQKAWIEQSDVGDEDYVAKDIDAWRAELRRLCQNTIAEYELDEKNRGSLDYGRPRSFYAAEFARRVLEMLQE